jgi:hypothetical protein
VTSITQSVQMGSLDNVHLAGVNDNPTFIREP